MEFSLQHVLSWLQYFHYLAMVRVWSDLEGYKYTGGFYFGCKCSNIRVSSLTVTRITGTTSRMTGSATVTCLKWLRESGFHHRPEQDGCR